MQYAFQVGPGDVFGTGEVQMPGAPALPLQGQRIGRHLIEIVQVQGAIFLLRLNGRNRVIDGTDAVYGFVPGIAGIHRFQNITVQGKQFIAQYAGNGCHLVAVARKDVVEFHIGPFDVVI